LCFRCYFFLALFVFCVFVAGYDFGAVLPGLVKESFLFRLLLVEGFWVCFGVWRFFFFFVCFSCFLWFCFWFWRCRSCSICWSVDCFCGWSWSSWSDRFYRSWFCILGWFSIISDIKWSDGLRPKDFNVTPIQRALVTRSFIRLSSSSPNKSRPQRCSRWRHLRNINRRRCTTRRVGLLIELHRKLTNINTRDLSPFGTIKQVLYILYSDQYLVLGHWKSLIIKLANQIVIFLDLM